MRGKKEIVAYKNGRDKRLEATSFDRFRVRSTSRTGCECQAEGQSVGLKKREQGFDPKGTETEKKSDSI